MKRSLAHRLYKLGGRRQETQVQHIRAGRTVTRVGNLKGSNRKLEEN